MASKEKLEKQGEWLKKLSNYESGLLYDNLLNSINRLKDKEIFSECPYDGCDTESIIKHNMERLSTMSIRDEATLILRLEERINSLEHKIDLIKKLV